MSATPLQPRAADLRGKRLLIFIVAYNAESTIEKVLSRIPSSLHSDQVEVLIIDDSSKDQTFVKGLRYEQNQSQFKITVLKTPENQGYGGNQKLGYRYAIDHGFDLVALLHGDGSKTRPRNCPLSSRLLPPTKPMRFLFAHDRQNAPPGAAACLSISGSGPDLRPVFKPDSRNGSIGVSFRLSALFYEGPVATVPFEKNTNDFHFDTEIIIQFVLSADRRVADSHLLRRRDLPRQRDEVRVGCFPLSMLRARAPHQMNIFFDRKPDVILLRRLTILNSVSNRLTTAALAAARPGSRILDVGCGQGYIASELLKRGCFVTGWTVVPEASKAPGSDRLPPFAGTLIAGSSRSSPSSSSTRS